MWVGRVGPILQRPLHALPQRPYTIDNAELLRDYTPRSTMVIYKLGLQPLQNESQRIYIILQMLHT